MYKKSVVENLGAFDFKISFFPRLLAVVSMPQILPHLLWHGVFHVISEAKFSLALIQWTSQKAGMGLVVKLQVMK